MGLALTLTACTGHGDGDSDEDLPDTDEPGPTDLVGDTFAPSPTPTTLNPDAKLALASQLEGILSAGSVAGTTQSVIVVDAENGEVVFEKNADAFLIPASNTKLFTSAAAMEALSADHRFKTRAYSTAEIQNGVLEGDLYVVGNHDFTPSTRFYPNATLPLDRFATALAQRGLTRVEGSVILAGEMLYEGYNFGTYNAANARAAAVVQLESALVRAGITAVSMSTTANFEPPAGATIVAEHGSAPLSVACVPLNVISHNEFADILLRHVGSELGGTSSYATGESEILTWLESLGLPTDGISLKDGSGLSRQNRVSARTVASLLGTMVDRPVGPDYLRTLTISGIRGTLGGRLGGADTVGRFFGKTGTLNGVIATSGVLFHRHDKRRYLISVLMNSVGSAPSARSIQDQVVASVAANIRTVLPPAAPTLLATRNHRSNLRNVSTQMRQSLVLF